MLILTISFRWVESTHQYLFLSKAESRFAKFMIVESVAVGWAGCLFFFSGCRLFFHCAPQAKSLQPNIWFNLSIKQPFWGTVASYALLGMSCWSIAGTSLRVIGHVPRIPIQMMYISTNPCHFVMFTSTWGNDSNFRCSIYIKDHFSVYFCWWKKSCTSW